MLGQHNKTLVAFKHVYALIKQLFQAIQDHAICNPHFYNCILYRAKNVFTIVIYLIKYDLVGVVRHRIEFMG